MIPVCKPGDKARLTIEAYCPVPLSSFQIDLMFNPACFKPLTWGKNMVMTFAKERAICSLSENLSHRALRFKGFYNPPVVPGYVRIGYVNYEPILPFHRDNSQGFMVRENATWFKGVGDAPIEFYQVRWYDGNFACLEEDETPNRVWVRLHSERI